MKKETPKNPLTYTQRRIRFLKAMARFFDESTEAPVSDNLQDPSSEGAQPLTADVLAKLCEARKRLNL